MQIIEVWTLYLRNMALPTAMDSSTNVGTSERMGSDGANAKIATIPDKPRTEAEKSAGPDSAVDRNRGSQFATTDISDQGQNLQPPSHLTTDISDEVTARSDMEELDTNKTKVSDSAYSISCNSRSQRSSGSSKSRHSASSNSSGYGGHASTLCSVSEFTQPAVTKHSKDKKKKNARSGTGGANPVILIHDEQSDTSGIVSDVGETKAADATSVTNGTAAELGLGPELVFAGHTSPHENDALQMAALNQTLSFIQKLKNSNEVIISDAKDEEMPKPNSDFSPDKTYGQEEFMVIISMIDGIVKFVSGGIKEVLGFPHDMWIGRSITDFVQPKDRAAFASHITSGVASPLTQLHKDCERRPPFFCNLRCYRGLFSCGFGIKDKVVQYKPCRLMLTFREHLNGFPFVNSENSSKINNEGREPPQIYLVINITSISSAFSYSEDIRPQPKFATRLLASTHLSEVDAECVPCLGYLPQDMLGRSLLDFYHPDDMPFMKDVFKAVVKEQGVPFLSKPYRFRAQNGCYLLLETEWSSFCNPWSRKLEFVIAQHRVVKGPQNPNVFEVSTEIDTQISEEILKKSKTIQEEIQAMINETILNTTENTKKRILSKHCRVLASFVDSMLEETKKPDLRLDVPQEDQSFSERGSVMLGEISPHHDYCDSKSSSETPPSYNQLNYNDNIQRYLSSLRANRDASFPGGCCQPGDTRNKELWARFFESKPKTTTSSDESGKEKSGSPGKSSPIQDSSMTSGDSGSGGGSGELSGCQDSATSSSHNSYQQPILTEALLTKHNENMEKRLVQKHRELRGKTDKRDKYHKQQHGGGHHGVKRIGSHSWENDSFKGSKHLHVEATGGAGPPSETAPLAQAPAERCTGKGNSGDQGLPPPTATGPGPAPKAPVTTVVPSCIYQNASGAPWTPFSVTVTPMPSSNSAGTYSPFSLVGAGPHIMPMYYMPSMSSVPQDISQPAPNLTSRNTLLTTPTFLPTNSSPHLQLLYQAVPHPLLYSPLSTLHPAPTMLPTSLFPPGACPPGELPQPIPVQAQASGRPYENVVRPAQLGKLPRQLQHPFQQTQQFSNVEEGGSGSHKQGKFQRPSSQATSVKAEPGSAVGSVASASRRAPSVSSNKNKSMSVCGDLSPDEDKAMDDGIQCSENFGTQFGREDGDSYYSSFYSYLCTDNSDESMPSCRDEQQQKKDFNYGAMQESTSSDCISAPFTKSRPVRSGPPPWMDGVTVTPDLVMHYQLDRRDMAEVLSADLMTLARIQQPSLVNEQLSQLYEDLALEGSPTSLALEEGITSSSCSSSEEWAVSRNSVKVKKKRRSMEYGRLIMIFEENAPLPPPITTIAT